MDERLFKLLIRKFTDKSFNAHDFAFYSGDEIKGNESRFHVSSRVFVVPKQQINNCGFWIHEFTELSIIGLIESEGLDWRRFINWKKYGFKSTIISHIISPYGDNNERCLIPQLSKKHPKW